MIIDLHTHTQPNSDDSHVGPDQLIERAKQLGLDGVCITDHDRFWRHEEIATLAKAHNFLVLPGCEVTTEEGHLLVFGLRQYVFGMHRAAFVRRLVDQAGGAMLLAHPYRRTYYREREREGHVAYRAMVERACTNRVFSLVEGIEVLNGRGSDPENAFALDIAERLNLKGVGTSDSHRMQDLGTFATEFQRPVRCLEDLVAELKAGRFRPVALNGRARPGAKLGGSGIA